MPSGLMGLNTALQALVASQQAINIVSHNIANVNTPGYSRQQPILAAEGAYTLPEAQRGSEAGQVGTGVRLVEVRRVADTFLANHVRLQSQQMGQWTAIQDTLQELEAILGEPSDVGLAAEIDSFWASWGDLAADPQNIALRSAVLEAGKRLASKFGSLTKQISISRQSLNHQISNTIEEINDIGQAIADLNVEIARIRGAQDTPGDLLDQRDILLDRLAELGNFVVAEEENGAVSVFLGGHHLVWQGQAATITTDASLDPANLTITWKDDASVVRATSGRLAGLVTARDEIIAGLQDDLDALAAAVVESVNGLHRSGFGLDGSTGLDFFTGSTAGHIALNPALDHTDKLATAGPSESDPTSPSGPGDGSIALQISLLVEAKVMDGDRATVNDYYRDTIGQLGAAAQNAARTVESARILVEHLNQRRQAVSGVSLDEETINLVQFERAYQAAARLVTVIDEMLDRLINQTGLVGR